MIGKVRVGLIVANRGRRALRNPRLREGVVVRVFASLPRTLPRRPPGIGKPEIGKQALQRRVVGILGKPGVVVRKGRQLVAGPKRSVGRRRGVHPIVALPKENW